MIAAVVPSVALIPPSPSPSPALSSHPLFLQCYTMVTADESQVITILIVLFASTVFGAKMAGLGTYKEAVCQKIMFCLLNLSWTLDKDIWPWIFFCNLKIVVVSRLRKKIDTRADTKLYLYRFEYSKTKKRYRQRKNRDDAELEFQRAFTIVATGGWAMVISKSKSKRITSRADNREGEHVLERETERKGEVGGRGCQTSMIIVSGKRISLYRRRRKEV